LAPGQPLRIGKIHYANRYFGITVPDYLYQHRLDGKPEMAKRQKYAGRPPKEGRKIDGSPVPAHHHGQKANTYAPGFDKENSSQRMSI
jgi:hypothetical protein